MQAAAAAVQGDTTVSLAPTPFDLCRLVDLCKCALSSAFEFESSAFESPAIDVMTCTSEQDADNFEMQRH